MTDASATTVPEVAPAAAPKLIVHHLNASRSHRILWLLEELEVPYDIKNYTRTEEMRAPEELKKIHPLGKAPAITDGDVNLAESGAIVEYVIKKYGAGKATPSEAGYIDNLYFTHYAEGSLMPLLVQKLINEIVPQRSPFLVRPVARVLFGAVTQKVIDPQIKMHAEFVEKHLEKTNGSWFAGGDHPTAADFQMYFPLVAIVKRGGDQVGPKTKEYVKMVEERPAFKRVIEKAGPLEL